MAARNFVVGFRIWLWVFLFTIPLSIIIWLVTLAIPTVNPQTGLILIAGLLVFSLLASIFVLGWSATRVVKRR